MPKLKQLINRHLYTVTFILVFFNLMIASIIQVKIAHDQANDEALRSLAQIEQIISENQKELETVQEEYRATCLLNAKVVSRLIESSPEILYDLDELKALAAHLEIDEIHFFDTTGRIFSGTHPQYYNYTFDSGEQMAFFKPMLTDKSLELVQEITPNTAEEKSMQYSALWSKNKEYIIQIGMEPVNVKKRTAKNELSYIFSLFRVNPYVFYYAIDVDTGNIVGASSPEEVNLHCSEIGFSLDDIKNSENNFHANINGKDSHCVFHKIDSSYVIYVINLQYLYRELPSILGILFIGMAIVAFVLATSLNEYMKRNIVEKLHKINSSLTAITQGDLNQVVDVRNIYELSELSTHINTMVQSLFSSNAKLTYVLSKTNFYLGTYEYINDGDRVHFSEYIPKLFSLDEKTAKKFSSNPDDFKNFLNEIQKHEVMGEPNIYELAGKYLKIDEIMDIDYVLGVVMDVTNTIQKRKKLELEVHLDPLTGLYNRKGLEAKLAELFSSPETLEYYAIIMIMADGLININTTYGSDYGDIYLQKLAGIITDFGIRNSIAARQWGGEFILFLYGYQNENELSKSINLLSYLQEHSLTHLDDNMDVPLEFSFMYYSSNGSECSDYRELLKKIK